MNVVKAAIAEGRPSCGLWSSGPSALAAEVLGKSGIDWVLLDQQHGTIGPSDLVGAVQAIQLGGSHALVRVAENNPSLIMRALDLGAVGVVVPMVNTVEEAQAAVDATRYPPLGTRSFGPVRSTYDPAAANADVLCLVMIETAEALANVEQIAVVPGLDGLFVGPMDLGLALGAPLGDLQDPRVVDAIATIVKTAERLKIIPGVAGFSPDHAESLLEVGARLVTIGSDLGYVSAGLARDRERIARWETAFGRGPLHSDD